VDRQTDTHTDRHTEMLITLLRTPNRHEVNMVNYNKYKKHQDYLKHVICRQEKTYNIFKN